MSMGEGEDGTAGHLRVAVYAIGGNALSDPANQVMVLEKGRH